MNKFVSFHVKRYRSLLDVKVSVSDEQPIIICGENNIGKTNLLRALNIFFNHINHQHLFNPKEDIPHHIYYGSQGAGSKTELVGLFEIDGNKTTLKVTFSNDGETSYLLSGRKADVSEVADILSKFRYLFIESHNIDLPKLISIVLEKDGLLPLDAKRKRQSQPLQKLEEFISLSQLAISDIERDINSFFKNLTDFDGILQGKEIKINFAEFERLRDVVKTMTSITLYDGNNHGIASKGSGAQRAVFLALMQFISKNYKNNVIWGIDEPEAFLQPSLQRRVFAVLCDIVSKKKQPMILTTHSQHMINLKNLRTTYLYKGEISPRAYKRKPNQVFYEMNTEPVVSNSDYEKAALIKKHLGIKNNDGWEVLPYNIIVEGEEDKKYLELLINSIGLPLPNIVFSGGASKIGGYLQFYNIFAKDLHYRPEFVCIFDNDQEGREQSKKVKPQSYSHINVNLLELPRHDGATQSSSNAEWEIEDFLPPEIVIQTVNGILKKEKYKPIRVKQIRDRSSAAHSDKQILLYAEECCNQNNPSLSPFRLNNEGRKKQICQRLCEAVELKGIQILLDGNQKSFLKGIVG